MTRRRTPDEWEREIFITQLEKIQLQAPTIVAIINCYDIAKTKSRLLQLEALQRAVKGGSNEQA